MEQKQLHINLIGHQRPVVHFAFSKVSENGYFMISASKDGKPMLRKGETGDWIGTFEGHKGAVWGVALNADTTKAASASADFSAIVWDAVTGKSLYSLAHKHIVKSVVFNDAADKLLTGEKVLRVFDLTPTGPVETIQLAGHTSHIKSGLWLEDNKTVVSIAEDKTMRVWDVTSGQEVRKIDLPANAYDLELNSNKDQALMVCGEKVFLWDMNTFSTLNEFTVPSDIIYSASFHPNPMSADERVFVCGGKNCTVYKYSMDTGIELESSKGHFGPVHCIRYSPDGHLYASGSEDGTIRLWQNKIGMTYGLWHMIGGNGVVTPFPSPMVTEGLPTINGMNVEVTPAVAT